MSNDYLSQRAVNEFNNFVSSLRSSQAANSDVGKDDPPATVNCRQATGAETADLFLRKRPELEQYRQALLETAASKYSFDNDQWCKTLVSVGGELL